MYHTWASVCSLEGKLWISDSSDPSAWVSRNITHTLIHTHTFKHTSSYLLPLCSHWFFPTQYCTAPGCSADCTSRTARGEDEEEGGGGGEEGRGEGGGEAGDTDVAVALLFNTLIIRGWMMKGTWIRHEEELRDTWSVCVGRRVCVLRRRQGVGGLFMSCINERQLKQLIRWE